MTRFERDYNSCMNGEGVVVLKERKAELDRLWKQGRECRNSFRMQCIAQEYGRRLAEYEELCELV